MGPSCTHDVWYSEREMVSPYMAIRLKPEMGSQKSNWHPALVSFIPRTRHSLKKWQRPLCATFGLMHCGKSTLRDHLVGMRGKCCASAPREPAQRRRCREGSARLCRLRRGATSAVTAAFGARRGIGTLMWPPRNTLRCYPYAFCNCVRHRTCI
jgi:hypothetical protein